MRSLVLCMSLLMISTLATTPAAVANDCEYSKPLNAQLDAAGASELRIKAEAGYLIVEGSRGASQVTVEGRACASKESRLDDIELEAERKGDRLVVAADMPDWNFGNGYARLDLKITVPSELALYVEDGSGSTEIRGVASLDLVDGSGEIDVREVYGDVEIEDGSGEIDLRDVTGSVTLSDGSGSVKATDVGSVRFENDGSGEIELVRVQGDVIIESDGSGGITIRDVTGTVRVGSDGSGSIWVSQVSGGFELGSDGSGSVHIDDVEGTVSLP